MNPKSASISSAVSTQGRKIAIADLSDEWLAFVESCLEHFAIIDRAGRIIYTNRGIPGMFAADRCGETLIDCVPNEHRLALEHAMSRASSIDGDKEIQVAAVERTPEMVSYAIKLCPIHRDDNVIGFLLSSHDISDHIENEARLTVERNRAQQYLDIADVILVALDNRGTVKLINRKGADLLGYHETEIIGRNWFDHFLPAQIGSTVKQVFNRLMLGEIEPAEYYENPVLTRTGEERLIAWHNTIIRGDRGQISTSLSSGEDITEQRQAEAQVEHYRVHLETLVSERTAQLAEANEKLRQAYQERIDIEEQVQEHRAQLAHVCRLSTMAELATTISHELNQPLSAVTNYATGVRLRARESATMSPEILEALDQIVVQAERAAKVLQTTREFVTKRDVCFQEVAVDETVQQAVELLKPKAKRQAVRIQVFCDEQLPVIRGDAIQLEQVIVNLLSNAIESLDQHQDGTRQIEVVATQTADHQIEISVHDNGPGLAKEMAKRVFDAFTTTKANGMGMGLSISRTIVEAHGGSMWVDTETNSGATVRVALPVKHKARQ